jgi:signal transduction histidine kinase
MADEVLTATTTRFFRASERGGYGIGLSIATRAVEAAGGRLEIESEVGRGTTVRAIVPAGSLVAR